MDQNNKATKRKNTALRSMKDAKHGMRQQLWQRMSAMRSKGQHGQKILDRSKLGRHRVLDLSRVTVPRKTARKGPCKEKTGQRVGGACGDQPMMG